MWAQVSACPLRLIAQSMASWEQVVALIVELLQLWSGVFNFIILWCGLQAFGEAGFAIFALVRCRCVLLPDIWE
jgi:hypothetical protein